jgi:hypothetical protein
MEDRGILLGQVNDLFAGFPEIPAKSFLKPLGLK